MLSAVSILTREPCTSSAFKVGTTFDKIKRPLPVKFVIHLILKWINLLSHLFENHYLKILYFTYSFSITHLYNKIFYTQIHNFFLYFNHTFLKNSKNFILLNSGHQIGA